VLTELGARILVQRRTHKHCTTLLVAETSTTVMQFDEAVAAAGGTAAGCNEATAGQSLLLAHGLYGCQLV
jgi:hypothetical protein